MAIWLRLAAVREAAALNKKELAQRAGLSRETVSRIETLKRPAEPATVRALATALAVEPVVLVTPSKDGTDLMATTRTTWSATA